MKRTSLATLKQAISKQSNDYSKLEREYKQKTGVSLLSPNALPPKATFGKPLTASIIIPAYNVKSSILACLVAIERSSFNTKYQERLQVIVVDDGSTDNTWDIIKKAKLFLHLTVLRQTNHGQAQALNTGISIAKGDIIISCDPDMILGFYAIEHFVSFHQQIPNALFVGFRQDTPATNPQVDANFIKQNGTHKESYFKNDARIVFTTPGWPVNMCLASEHFKGLGQEYYLWMPDNTPWLLPDMVFGALFSLPRLVFLAIGGYEEKFVGWGCTDSYLAAKVIGAGNYIIPLYAASGLHITHPPRLKNKLLQYKRNRKLFFKLIQTTNIDNHHNWLADAKDRIIESFVRNLENKPLRPSKNSLLVKKPELSINEIDNLLAVGEYSQALTVISNKNIKKNDWEMNLRLGKAFLGLNMYKEAIDIFSEVPKYNNFLPDTALELVVALGAYGKFESAKKILDELIKTHPQYPNSSYLFTHNAQEHIKAGQKYLNQGFLNVALRCFELALIVEPKNNVAFKLQRRCLQTIALPKAK